MSHIAIDARLINSTTGRYIERLIHYLELIDEKNSYSILVRRKDLDFYKPSNPRFSVVEADYADYSLGEQIGLRKLLDDLKPDLVHFCMPQQPVRYKGKKVTTIHDLTLLKTYNSDKNWFVYHFKQLVGKYVFRSVVENSAKIITPSKYTALDLSTSFPAANNKTVITYESADVDTNTLETYNHGFKHYILYVGQQSDYKNIRRLGEAHQLLLQKYPDLGLVLVGRKNASAKRNEDYFKSKKYNNILFTDFIPDSQKDWLYQNAEAYVFPSLMEGFGLPGLEAMGYGAPVVSSNATCLPEVYGEAAIYFDPFSTQDMAEKIAKVIDDKALRASMIEKGHAQLAKYSWERMAKQTLEVYEQVLAER